MQDAAGAKLSRPSRSDALVAIAVLAAAELEVVLAGLGPATAAAAAIASLALAFRRCAPVLTVLVVVAVLVLDEPLGDSWTEQANAGVLLLLLASYSLGAYANSPGAFVGAALALAVLAAAELLQHGSDYAFLLLIVVMPWLAGRAVRHYRTRAERLVALAGQLEHERLVSAQLAVAEERERMAAELDDAIGHAVTTMVVQAGAAEEVLSRSPARAGAALAAVQETGRDAISELRLMLDVLCEPRAGVCPEPAAAASTVGPSATPRRISWSSQADLGLAVLALALGVAFALVDDAMAGVRVPVALLQVAAGGAIALRSRAPVAALLVALAAMAAESVLTGAAPEAPTSLAATLLALYSVAAHGKRRDADVAGALGVSIPCVLQVTVAGGDAADLVLIVALFATPWLAGRAVHASRRQADRLRVLTERLERERGARVRLALVEERNRVARELHDSIAHAVSVMLLQAGGAEEMLELAPDRARAAMHAVQDLGRETLDDLQRMPGVLTPNEGRAARQPQVGLAQLDTLVEQVRRAGLPVRVAFEGAPTTLTTGVDICAYRIIQEALTNALKHAGPVPTRVTLAFGRDSLRIDVVDEGTGSDASMVGGAGRGLIGMRERVAVYGGSLDAGPRPGGGYAVRARLTFERAPTDGHPAAPLAPSASARAS